MKKIITRKSTTILILVFFISYTMIGQINTITQEKKKNDASTYVQKYFQQEANYTIDVALDDQAHTLKESQFIPTSGGSNEIFLSEFFTVY